MELPELPQFDIPLSCRGSQCAMTLAQYEEWVVTNVRELWERGLYRKYREMRSRTPVDARFSLGRDAEAGPR